MFLPRGNVNMIGEGIGGILIILLRYFYSLLDALDVLDTPLASLASLASLQSGSLAL